MGNSPSNPAAAVPPGVRDDGTTTSTASATDNGTEPELSEETETPPPSFTTHTSIADLVDQYDAFIVDQWGVMHNGIEPIEGAPEAVAHLAAQSKKMVILSNTSSTEEATLERLKSVGLDRSHFTHGALTSGDLAADYIVETYGGGDNNDDKKKKKKTKALLFAWKHPAAPASKEFLDKCQDCIELVDSPDDEPQFLLLHGNEIILGPEKRKTSGCFVVLDWLSKPFAKPQTSRLETSLGDFVLSGDTTAVIDPILQECLELQIPAICCDRDYTTVDPDGTTFYMPGTIAKRYEELGGKVVYFGKPSSPGFTHALERLAPLTKIAHIGDSLPHDIAGANAAGIDSIFVCGGVHRQALHTPLGELPSDEALTKLFEQEEETPTHVIPLLQL